MIDITVKYRSKVERIFRLIKATFRVLTRTIHDENTPMIYCIGKAENYDLYIAKYGNAAMKQGRGIDYEGGSVWKTREEAEMHIKRFGKKLSGYKVYGVMADWQTDTEPSMAGPFHDLIVDAPLVRLDDNEQ